jgi:hypothetical protein
MEASPRHSSLPPGLDLKTASFYSAGGSVNDVKLGTRNNQEYVVFDYNPNSETSQRQTVIAVRTHSPNIPGTSLSATSGIQLERVGQWVLAFELGREIRHDQIEAFMDDVLKLLEYARGFPQNFWGSPQ